VLQNIEADSPYYRIILCHHPHLLLSTYRYYSLPITPILLHPRSLHACRRSENRISKY